MKSAEDQVIDAYDRLVEYGFHASVMNEVKQYAVAYVRYVLEIQANNVSYAGHRTAADLLRAEADRMAS